MSANEDAETSTVVRALKILVVALIFCGATIPQTAPVAALTPYVDTHVHFDGDAQTVVAAALQALGGQNAAKFFFLSPPDISDTPNRVEFGVLLPLVPSVAKRADFVNQVERIFNEVAPLARFAASPDWEP